MRRKALGSNKDGRSASICSPLIVTGQPSAASRSGTIDGERARKMGI
jgi:hypothetical protein